MSRIITKFVNAEFGAVTKEMQIQLPRNLRVRSFWMKPITTKNFEKENVVHTWDIYLYDVERFDNVINELVDLPVLTLTGICTSRAANGYWAQFSDHIKLETPVLIRNPILQVRHRCLDNDYGPIHIFIEVE